MQQEQGKYNKKRLLALGVLVLLLLILIFLLWWWFFPRQSTPEGPVPTATEPAQETVVLTPQQPQAPAEEEAPVYAPVPGETEIRALARNFTERYGSWSTDSNFQNLKDLFPRVTSRLEASFQRTIDTATTPTEFKSVETRVLQIDVQSLTETKASVLVTAQQVTRNASLEESEGFVKLDLSLIKDGEFWYVDSAEWQ